MALIAEEIVEEWLNRRGYFTIRGIRAGVQEIDLLALRMVGNIPECRHIEVQASSRPVSYLFPLSSADQKATGRKPMSTKLRTEDELARSCAAWVSKKYEHPAKLAIKRALWAGDWTRELVVHRVKHDHELRRVMEAGVGLLRLSEIVRELHEPGPVLPTAAGTALLELLSLSDSTLLPSHPTV